jgi:hypothetical protein
MSRPKNEIPLVKKIAQAFKAVGKLPRNGKNLTRHYNWTRATDVLEAVRLELFNRDVLICPSEGVPEYVAVGPTNGGEQLTECRLAVTYVFRDATGELPPITINGIGRDVEDKSLYKAQTGAQKALLKRFGLMAEVVDDPEFDGYGAEQAGETGESIDDVAPMRVPSSQKPVTPLQVDAFQKACAENGKTADEISHYLAGEHKVDAIEKLRRGKPFTAAIRWASDGKGTLAAPKPQAVPDQGRLPLRTAPVPVELKIGNKAIQFEPKKSAYSV